jgi:hypothetical protein
LQEEVFAVISILSYRYLDEEDVLKTDALLPVYGWVSEGRIDPDPMQHRLPTFLKGAAMVKIDSIRDKTWYHLN